MNSREVIDRNFAMNMVRVTEAAAIAAAQHMGMGDKELVDQAAVDAMRFTLGSMSMDGVVVIGEGEKDEAPMLYNGEVIGDGAGPGWFRVGSRNQEARSVRSGPLCLA